MYYDVTRQGSQLDRCEPPTPVPNPGVDKHVAKCPPDGIYDRFLHHVGDDLRLIEAIFLKELCLTKYFLAQLNGSRYCRHHSFSSVIQAVHKQVCARSQTAFLSPKTVQLVWTDSILECRTLQVEPNTTINFADCSQVTPTLFFTILCVIWRIRVLLVTLL